MRTSIIAYRLFDVADEINLDQVQIFLVGDVFLRRDVEEDADDTQVLDAGLDLYQVIGAADVHFMVT